MDIKFFYNGSLSFANAIKYMKMYNTRAYKHRMMVIIIMII